MPQKRSLVVHTNLADDSLYEKDFYKWTEEQAELLKEGKYENLDIEHLREEIESLGKSDKRALKSYLIIILQHLLKINYAPGWQENSNSWMTSIENSKIEIRLLLEDSPSLKKKIKSCS
ncbi:MAG: DUF29 domain-containing protein [Parachlamydiaceae bacterium]|nr:DUF29 domain-containing protein [Parachlamydiaceae bacterium]